MKKNSVEEKRYYDILEAVDEIDKRFAGQYFPTIQELEIHKVKENIDRFMPLIAYFASDPYKDVEWDEEDTRVKYKATVKYLKDIANNAKLV